LVIIIFLLHLNEHNNRGKHERGTTLNNYNVSDYDNNNRHNGYIEFNSEKKIQVSIKENKPELLEFINSLKNN
jgi:hypothetical protein